MKTPKQKVLDKYPDAVCRDIGGTTSWRFQIWTNKTTQHVGALSGMATCPQIAWRDAWATVQKSEPKMGHMNKIPTPRSDKLERLRAALKQPTNAAYLSALRLCRQIERELFGIKNRPS